jgi:murein DD-endopeptidase MepM/ murein hydrolase activator NlpD
MAKKNLGGSLDDLDLDNLDSEFDLDGFDIDNLDSDNKGRDASKNKGKGIFSKLAKFIDKKELSTNFLSGLLPREYETTLDSLKGNIDTAKSLYDSTATPIKESLRRNRSTLKELTPLVGNLFGDKAKSKYSEKVGELQSNTSYFDTNDESTTDNYIRTTLSDIFKEKSEEDNDYRKKEMAQRIISERKADLRFNKSFSMSTGIYTVNKRLLDYFEQVDYKYKQKHLEFVARSYLEDKKHHKLAEANMVDTTRMLKAIVHNSALPDIQKMHFSEQAKGMFREKVIGAAQALPSEMASKYLGSVFKGVGDRVSNFMDDFFGNVSSILASREASKEMAQFGMANDAPGGMLGEMGISLLSGILGSSVGEWVGNKTGIKDKKSLKNVFNKLTYFADNSQKILADKLLRGEGLLGKIGELGAYDKVNFSLGGDKLADSAQGTVYDNASRKSLVEIIPGYLARILKSTESIRTGRDESMVRYDFTRNEFTSEEELLNRTIKTLKDDSSLKDMQDKVDKLLEKLIGNKKISGKAVSAIRKEIYSRLMEGKMFSPSELKQTRMYRTNLDESTSDEIRQLFSEYSDQNVFSKEFWTSDKNTDLIEMDNLYNSAMRSHPDVVKEARSFASVGQKDLFKQMGLLNAEGDGIDDDKLIEFYMKNKDIAKYQPIRDSDSIFTSRGGFTTNSGRDINAYQSFNGGFDYSKFEKSNSILEEIRDAINSAQEVKAKILSVEEEIREFTKNIYEFLPEINNISYNISGEELASNFYSHIKKDVNSRYSKFKRRVRRGGTKAFKVLKSPFSFAKRGVTTIRDKLCDVYVKGRDGVVLYASKLKAGEYFDQATGAVIKSFKDIKGTVVDENGNIILTIDDIKQGLVNSRGKKILDSLWGRIKDAGGFVASTFNALNPLFHLNNIRKRITKGIKDWWAEEAMDVYVVGESSPRLLKMIFKNKGYYSKATGRILTGADKIDGEVVDKEGNVLLSNDDIKKGLVDKYGKPLKFGIAKHIGRGLNAIKLLAKPFQYAAGLAKKGVRSVFKGAAALGRFLFGRGFSEAAADKALPEDASLEARYLNRIYFFLRATFGGAVNGFFNKTYQAGRGFGQRIGGFFKSAKEKAREKYHKSMKDKIASYGYKRWFKRVKEDRIKDEEKRKNSWRWKLKNRKKKLSPKNAKKKALSKFGWLGFVLSGIMTLGSFLVKNLTKGIFKVAKLITKGIGKVLGPMLKGVLGGIGSLAKGALSIGGKAIGSAAMWAGRGLLTAGTFLLTTPIGLTIGAVALVAVAGYMAWKWWKGRLKPLQKYRYAQYGADLKNDEVLEGIAAAEKYFYDNLSFSSAGKPPTIGKSFDVNYFANLCGCSLGDQNDQSSKWWCSWFDRRFTPVAIKWAITMQEYSGTKPFYDADDNLKDSEKVQFALKVAFDEKDPNCPYNLRGGPNPFYPTIVGNGVINQMLHDIHKRYFDDIPKSEQGTVDVEAVISPQIKIDPKIKEKIEGAKDIDHMDTQDLKIDISSGDKVLLIDSNNMHEIQIDESITRNQETASSGNDFTWVRMLTYGLLPEHIKQSSIVNKMLAFEMMVLTEYMEIEGDKVYFVGDEQSFGYRYQTSFFPHLYKRARAVFGWDEDRSSDIDKLVVPFLCRFLAIFGKYLAVANKLCSGINIFDIYKQPNTVLYPLAIAINSTMLGEGKVLTITPGIGGALPREAYEKGTRWSVWDVTGGIIPGYQLNTDAKTVSVYLEALDPDNASRTSAKDDKGKDGDSTGNNLADEFRKRYGLGSSGVTYADLQLANQRKELEEQNKEALKKSKEPENNRVTANPTAAPPNKNTPFDGIFGKPGGMTTAIPGINAPIPTGNSDDGGLPPYLKRTEKYGDSDDPDIEPESAITNGKSDKIVPGTLPPTAVGKWGTVFPTPNNNIVTSLFGNRQLDYETKARMHNGIDLRAKHGEPVVAFKDGIVVGEWNAEKVGDILIDHGDGTKTRYLHLSPDSKGLTKPGMRVKAGQQIGIAGGFGKGKNPKTGGTGNHRYDPHLHFEVIKDGKKVNPLEYLLAAGFDVREKLSNGVTARIDKPYRQENAKVPGYAKQRREIDRQLASSQSINNTKGGVDNTSSSETQTASTNPTPATNPGDNSILSTKSAAMSETGGDDQPTLPVAREASIFSSGDSRIDSLRRANAQGTDITLKNTNEILISTNAINSDILKELKSMNTKMDTLVDNSTETVKIMVGGKEMELKTGNPQGASDNPYGITRVPTSPSLVTFNKKAV